MSRLTFLAPPAAALAILAAVPAIHGQSLVAFGDSVTAPRGNLRVFADLLRSELQCAGRPVSVSNAGVSGDTTARALKRFGTDVLAAKPDVAILMFGINDAAVDVWKKPPAEAPRVPLADFRANLTRMVRELRQQGARVVLMTPNPLSWTATTRRLYAAAPYRPEEQDGFNVVLRGYAEAVRELARQEQAGLVDVFAAFEQRRAAAKSMPVELCPDGMHPGPAGHRLIAERLIAHLAAADPRYRRRPFTAWKPSGEVTEMHPRAIDITHDTPHPAVLGPALVKLGDGAVLSVYSAPTSYGGTPGECYIAGRVTRDGGSTWEPERELTRLPDGRAAHPAAHRARDGTLHVFFLGYVAHGWRDGNPTDKTRSDLWAVRSADGGRTWTAPQMIFEGYTGATNGAEETRAGQLVVPFSHYVANPGRLVSRTVVSADGGRTWRKSNALDIGGAGDHEGALEPCVVELRDGRLWMLIRTSRKFFWESFSSDGGLTWSEARPTAIPSSHSPGHVIRLSDGRLALAWNPVNRSELSVALSGDEGRSWPLSAVVVRGTGTYPFLLENRPGELWVGVMDCHGGWGKTPRARHLKIGLDDLAAAAAGNDSQ